MYGSPDRITELSDFFRTTINLIKPAVLLVTGDITDAKKGLGSVQYKNEWESYDRAVRESGVMNYTTVLDVPGNHDTFNVASYDSENAYFKDLSIQGAAGNHGSYLHRVEVNGRGYKFIAVDASLVPGPKRPFNFIGELHDQDMNHLRKILLSHSKRDYTIWFGHYPTSCIMHPEKIRNLIGGHEGSLVYLCGHLHTFAGLVPRMYSKHWNEGFLELELGDWKLNRRYRVAAVDHGLFSFVDLYANEFPIVLVTNPKDVAQHIPNREDPSVSLKSTHIRLLAFSTQSITDCRLRIDGGPFQECFESADAKNLFTTRWNPEEYKTGVHSIEVIVTDALGRQRTTKHEFAFDLGLQSTGFGVIGRFILNTNFTTMWIVLYAVVFCIVVGPLVSLRCWHQITLRKGLLAPKIRIACLRNFVRRFWLLASVDHLFFPMLAFYLYLLVGPWMVCEVIDGHLGWVFMWGIFVKGQFFPGTLSYLYGFTQLMFCQGPFHLVLGSMVDYKFRRGFIGVELKTKTTFQKIWPRVPFILIIVVEIILAILYGYQYGATGFVLGPLRTWSVALHLYLFYRAYHLKPHELAAGMSIWSNESLKRLQSNAQ